jgi:predicted acylesterase/phospholipase RssA
MQGIISAAMLMQLSVLGLRNTFDAVYGASAGAISGAYFVAGQVRIGSPETALSSAEERIKGGVDILLVCLPSFMNHV